MVQQLYTPRGMGMESDMQHKILYTVDREPVMCQCGYTVEASDRIAGTGLLFLIKHLEEKLEQSNETVSKYFKQFGALK